MVLDLLFMIKKEKNKKKFKSQFLVIGSLSILIGISIIGYHIYSDYRLKNIEEDNIQGFFEEEQKIDETPQEEVFVEVENKNVSEEIDDGFKKDVISLKEIVDENINKFKNGNFSGYAGNSQICEEFSKYYQKIFYRSQLPDNFPRIPRRAPC